MQKWKMFICIFVAYGWIWQVAGATTCSFPDPNGNKTEEINTEISTFGDKSIISIAGSNFDHLEDKKRENIDNCTMTKNLVDTWFLFNMGRQWPHQRWLQRIHAYPHCLSNSTLLKLLLVAAIKIFIGVNRTSSFHLPTSRSSWVPISPSSLPATTSGNRGTK